MLVLNELLAECVEHRTADLRHVNEVLVIVEIQIRHVGVFKTIAVSAVDIIVIS